MGLSPPDSPPDPGPHPQSACTPTQPEASPFSPLIVTRQPGLLTFCSNPSHSSSSSPVTEQPPHCQSLGHDKAGVPGGRGELRLFSQAGISDLQHPQALALCSDPQPQVSHLPLATPAGYDYDHSCHCHPSPLGPWRLTPRVAPGQREQVSGAEE